MKIAKRVTVLILTFILWGLLLMCYGIYLNAVIPPSKFAYFGILALVFPFSFGAYLLLVLMRFFWIHWKKNIPFLLLSIPMFWSFSNIYKVRISPIEPRGFKAMTYNVKYGYSGFEDLKPYIEDSQADIIFLQEIYQRHWRKEAFLPNHYNAVHDYVGISSKYPIIYSTQLEMHDSNGYACMADIDIGKDTIRAFSVYLGSIYLTQILKDFQENQEIERNSVRVKNKLINGYKNHEKQLDILIKYFRESPYPVIVGGDFNSVPMSYEYYKMKRDLRDAFSQKAQGWATSFDDYKFPIRIDYLFASEEFSPSAYWVDHEAKLSDHYPVFSFFEYKPLMKEKEEEE